MLDVRAVTEQIHLTIDGTLKNSWLSNFLGHSLVATIFVGFLSSFIQSEPSMMYTPEVCSSPVCDNDPNICPGGIVCAPEAPPVFGLVDRACIYIFTIEYGIRLLTCWAVSSRDLGIAPKALDKNDPAPVYDISEHHIRFIFCFKNVIDLATIFPYFISWGTGTTTGETTFLRALRLLRLFKLLRRLEILQIMTTMVLTAVKHSANAMAVVVGLLLIQMIFFACILYELESGVFTATAEYPHGAFLRLTRDGAGKEISPFLSIPTAFYYVILSLCLVGDDFATTSWEGRAISSVAMVCGLFMMVLITTILEVELTVYLDESREYNWRQAGAVIGIDHLDELGMIKLFQSVDTDGSGGIGVDELEILLRSSDIDLGRGWVSLMMDSEDCNNDGVISVEEFIAICYRLQGRIEESQKRQTSLKSRFISSILHDDVVDKDEDIMNLVAAIRREDELDNVSGSPNPRFGGNLAQPDAVENKWSAAAQVFHLADLDEEGMVKFFESIDRDGNGSIDPAEMESALRLGGLDLKSGWVSLMIKRGDLNSDGVVSLGEFTAICYKLQGREGEYERARQELSAEAAAEKRLGGDHIEWANPARIKMQNSIKRVQFQEEVSVDSALSEVHNRTDLGPIEEHNVFDPAVLIGGDARYNQRNTPIFFGETRPKSARSGLQIAANPTLRLREDRPEPTSSDPSHQAFFSNLKGDEAGDPSSLRAEIVVDSDDCLASPPVTRQFLRMQSMAAGQGIGGASTAQVADMKSEIEGIDGAQVADIKGVSVEMDGSFNSFDSLWECEITTPASRLTGVTQRLLSYAEHVYDLLDNLDQLGLSDQSDESNELDHVSNERA